MLADWWVEPGHKVSDCRILGVMERVLEHWCTGQSSGPSGGQGWPHGMCGPRGT